MNPVTYPNFIEFLKLKKIPLTGTEMSFSVSRDGGEFEWSGSSLSAVFCQFSNLFNLGMYRTLFDIIRFNTFATDLLDLPEFDELRSMSISTYLDRNGYSQDFRDNYLIVSLCSFNSNVAYDCGDLVYCTEYMLAQLPCPNVNPVHA